MVSKTIVAQVTVGTNPTPSALEPKSSVTPISARAIGVSVGVADTCVAFVLLADSPAGAWAADAARVSVAKSLSAADAAVLGVVEGVTEYLPVSSTGHLLVTARILDLPSSGKAGDAVKSYEIAIQFGAILAVLLLYRRRVGAMVEGLLGRSDEGRSLLQVVAIAFVPSAVIGVVSEKVIKDVLFGTWPVVVAWIVGGVVLIALSRSGRLTRPTGRALGSITTRDAMIIGGAQVFALWPGTSRSLVTIVAALLIGISMSAAVEFSFLLGFVTLAAATGYEMLSSGKTMIDTFGIGVPLLGMAVAFVAAAISIRWMVTYLTRHDLSIFGWYRIGIALIVIGLVASNAI
jgi:undecaprenyl-diphosphatase